MGHCWRFTGCPTRGKNASLAWDEESVNVIIELYILIYALAHPVTGISPISIRLTPSVLSREHLNSSKRPAPIHIPQVSARLASLGYCQTKMTNPKSLSIPEVVVSPTTLSDIDGPRTPRSGSTSSEASERSESSQRKTSIQWAEPVAVKPKKKSKPSIKRTLTLLA